MAKILVTHFSPDLDAVSGIWLIKKYIPDWHDAELRFVPAGETLNGHKVDSNPDILHIDTGLGQLDHHQTDKLVSAASLCLKKVLKEGREISKLEEKALERLVQVVTEVDHARDISWPEPDNDRYNFFLERIISGLVSLNPGKDEEAVKFGSQSLEAILKVLKDKIRASQVLENGQEFETKWGGAVAVETEHAEVKTLAQNMGYSLIVRKRPKSGHLSIYARWDRGVDLTPIYEQVRSLDSQATWFLHPSKCLLLNGSTKNPKMVASKLSLEEIIGILQGT